MLKLRELNKIDFWMYMTLCLTAFLSLCLALLEAQLTTDVVLLLFILIFAVNVIYVVYWIFKVGRFALKHMAMSERFVLIHSYLTCSCLKDHEQDQE